MLLLKFNYIEKLQRTLKYAYKKAKQVAQKQQKRHKGLYDQSCRGSKLMTGEIVLVRQTAWKGRHEIQDRWEDEGWCSCLQDQMLDGKKTRTLHRNLLLPL